MITAPEVLLSYRGASVGYAAKSVVRDATFQVRAGEIVGLVGPNGAGKSTLLRAVTGEALITAGDVELAGSALEAWSALERAGIAGVVPQQVVAAFSFPAREFVEMGRHPHLPRFGRPGPSDREAVEWAMRLTDTSRLADTPIDALSGGDLQRLAFAQALATRPRLLLLDEATAHLDLNHRLQILDLTRDLADEGLAVLAVFHDLDLAARYADRIAIVTAGEVREPVPPQDAITAARLHEVFGVRAVVGTDQVTGSVTVTPVLREGAVKPDRDAHVHVVGGAGSAAPLMRRLVLAGFRVTAGALNAGDADALLADALGIEYALIPPFEPMNAEAAVRVAQLAEEADAVVVCPVPFGHGNIDNLLIGVHARKPTVLIGDIVGRDYAGGAASSYWVEAINDGAVIVSDSAEAEAAVIALLS